MHNYHYKNTTQVNSLLRPQNRTQNLFPKAHNQVKNPISSSDLGEPELKDFEIFENQEELISENQLNDSNVQDQLTEQINELDDSKQQIKNKEHQTYTKNEPKNSKKRKVTFNDNLNKEIYFERTSDNAINTNGPISFKPDNKSKKLVNKSNVTNLIPNCSKNHIEFHNKLEEEVLNPHKKHCSKITGENSSLDINSKPLSILGYWIEATDQNTRIKVDECENMIYVKILGGFDKKPEEMLETNQIGLQNKLDGKIIMHKVPNNNHVDSVKLITQMEPSNKEYEFELNQYQNYHSETMKGQFNLKDLNYIIWNNGVKWFK